MVYLKTVSPLLLLLPFFFLQSDVTSFPISTLAPSILAGKQSCKTVLLPSLFITSCRRVSFHNNLGTLNYQYWRCAIARVRHKSTPMLLCRFPKCRLLLFYFSQCVLHIKCASERFTCKQGILVSTRHVF